MQEWVYAQQDPSEELTELRHFSVKKQQGDAAIEFLITVREYVSPPYPGMRFFAQADKETNQRTAPFTPCGWGATLLEALSTCLKEIRRFPYEASDGAARASGA